jgi:hypothetical protein
VAEHQARRVEGEDERSGALQDVQPEDRAGIARKDRRLHIVQPARVADAHRLDGVDGHIQFAAVREPAAKISHEPRLAPVLQGLQYLLVDGHVAGPGVDHQVHRTQPRDLPGDIEGGSALGAHIDGGAEFLRHRDRTEACEEQEQGVGESFLHGMIFNSPAAPRRAGGAGLPARV